MDFYAAMSRVYQPVTLEAEEIYKKKDGEEFYDSQIKQRARKVSREEFTKKFLPELKNIDKQTYEDYQSYQNGVEGTGERYKEYLNKYSKFLMQQKQEEVNKFLSRVEIPEIPTGEKIPSPLNILNQPPEPETKPGFFGKMRRALGFKEEVVNEQTLCESLQLKKLSLKEAMEKEYD